MLRRIQAVSCPSLVSNAFGSYRLCSHLMKKEEKARAALISLSWIVAFMVIYFIIVILSKDHRSHHARDVANGVLLVDYRTFTRAFFGKIVGLMITNNASCYTPSLRRILRRKWLKPGVLILRKQ